MALFKRIYVVFWLGGSTFLIMQKSLNFTATLKKRKDGKWGPTTVLANGTIITEGIVKSVTTGFGEMIVASYVAR